MTSVRDLSEWRTGWTVVLGAGIGSATGLGLLFYVSSLFVLPLSEAFGWSRGQIGTATGLSGIGAFAAPLIGWLVDRFGLRPVVTVCTLVASACYAGLATMQGDYWVFVVLAMGLGVFGLGTVGFVYTGLVAAWFDKSRGLALGVAASGVSFAAILAPPLMQMVIDDFGWRVGYWALGGVATLVGLPLVLVLLRPRQRPVAPAPALDREQTAAPSVAIGIALRSPVFWLLAVALLCINTAGTGALSQLSPLLREKGFSSEVAAYGITVYAVGLMIGRLGCGLLLDHIPVSRVAFVFTALPALGALVLLQPDLLVFVALGAALIVGLQQGSELDIMAYAVSRTFGLLNYTSIFGFTYVAGIVGNTFGSYAFGTLFDLTNSYDLALSVSAGLFMVGAFLFLMTGVGVHPKGTLNRHGSPGGSNS